MNRRPARIFVVAAACVATLSMTAVSQADPPTELPPGPGKAIPLKNAAMMEVNQWGYRYKSGQQNGDLTISFVNGNLLYEDTGTQELREIPNSCSRQSRARGIAALCDIPAEWADGSEMFLEVHPRLGNDVVDGSSLPARFRLWALMDKGDDTVRAGAGDDFVNGAQDHDKAWGGAGNDWLRGNIGNDVLWGEAGDDRLVGVYDSDEVHGGEGDDRVGGGPGSDLLWADSGRDVVACGDGPDDAWVDDADRTSQCESINR